MQTKWVGWFKNDADEADERLAQDYEHAKVVIDGFAHPFLTELLGWLEEESNKPMVVSQDHMVMITAATRANTMKEVRSHIVSEVTKADRLMKAVDGGEYE